MLPKSLIVVLALTALPIAGAAVQTPPPTESPRPARPPRPVRPVRHAPPLVEVNPTPLYSRRCVDWYELQHRPSGTVLFPQMRCWWVRG